MEPSSTELEKLKFRLEILKLLIDKLFIALVLVGVAFFANRSLETYKNNLHLEGEYRLKRIQAIERVKEMYADTWTNVFEAMIGKTEANPKQIEAATRNTLNQISKLSFFLSSREVEDLSECLWNFIGLSQIPTDQWKEYMDYFGMVTSNMRLVCRSAVGLPQDEKYFSFTSESSKHQNTKEYLLKNYELWKASEAKQ